MKRLKKVLFVILMSTILKNISCEVLYGKSFFAPRAQSTNSIRQAVGHHLLRHDHSRDSFSGTFTITPEYSQSFKSTHLAEYFFGTDQLTFSGSAIEDRTENDILADYFGLSPEFKGCIKLKPKIKTFLLDFDLFLGLDNIRKGLYFELYTPVVTTRWSICSKEEILSSGIESPFPENYMDEQSITAPVTCIKKALAGEISFGDVTEGIKCGKIGCPDRETKIADVTLVLGYLFINRENGYVGVNIRTTAPTGTRPNSNYLFEPIAGNGRHWELGFGFTGQVMIWEKSGDQSLALHFDTNFTHLFKAKQCRSFDFCQNGFGSRYILLKEFDEAGTYTGTTVPAINKTTLRCNVRIDFQADINIMFVYNNKNWEFDFGYNGWIRSRERICLLDSIEHYRFGLKGIQNVTITAEEPGGNNSGEYKNMHNSNKEPINTTQNCSTIYGNQFEDQEEVVDPTPPVFISNNDLDISSAESPRALTHKLYAHLSYAWKKENRRLTPYFGGGWQIEFESVKPRCAQPYKNTLSQWSLWLKGGFAFS